ncbi:MULTISPECIES: F0F1 ATP synthase subunit B family protein [unclassified Nocardia]|uniref:F0F1 ATP synthase subunit B family protein n=1 Tax=unclassified Nocardia TaxID=2637762 RepID=UPI002E1DB77F
MIVTSGILADGTVASGPYHITIQWPVFISQLCAFGCIVFVIVKWVLPPVKSMMVKSQGTIQKQIDQSEQTAVRLAEAKMAYANALAEAQIELDQLREDARVDAERIVAHMRRIADSEVTRVRKQGNDQIEQMRTQLIRDLTTDLSATVLERTEERVRLQLNSTHVVSDSIEIFLEDLEAMANGSPPVRRSPQSWAH